MLQRVDAWLPHIWVAVQIIPRVEQSAGCNEFDISPNPDFAEQIADDAVRRQVDEWPANQGGNVNRIAIFDRPGFLSQCRFFRIDGVLWLQVWLQCDAWCKVKQIR